MVVLVTLSRAGNRSRLLEEESEVKANERRSVAKDEILDFLKE